VNTQFKAVMTKIGIMKTMFENHPTTANEVNDRNWLDTCLVLVNRIRELEDHIREDMCDIEYECRYCHKSRVLLGIKPKAIGESDG
jgi:hypothetical protein